MVLKVRTKLLVFILSTTLIVFIISFGYLVIMINNSIMDDAVNHIDDVTNKSSLYLEQILNTDVEIVKTIERTIHNFDKLESEQREPLVNEIFSNILRTSPQFISLGTNWELSSVDSGYIKPFGRIRYIYSWENGTIKESKDSLNLNGDDLNKLYYKLKIEGINTITNPYFDSYTGLEEDKILMSSIVIPIIDGKFKGMVVADIALERFNTIVESIKPFTGANAFLISNEGNFVTFKDKNYINTKLENYFHKEAQKNNILDNIQTGKKISFFFTDSLDTDYYVSFFPINIGNFDSYWSVGVLVPISEIKSDSLNILSTTILVGFLGALILIIIIWYISKKITEPLEATTKVLTNLASGEINADFKIINNSKDEIGDISNSVNLLIDRLNKTANFAFEIGKGNLDTHLSLNSEKDLMSKALLEMRHSLQIAKIEEVKRKEIDLIQNWITQGEARFTEILRERSENLHEFSYIIISNLVKYIEANQGGIFIINDDTKNDIYLELTASYAYERRKIINKRVDLGIGLVGRCYQEAETIYMSDIPNDYLNITSGLGQNNPRHILIVPFKFNDEIYAVVELASFNKFEKHHIDFIERVGISIASTIGSVQINVRTSRLVEELKVQSEELSSQEEEMRQNMEEMQVTQEELTKKSIEHQNIFSALDKIVMVAEYNIDGKMIAINELFLKFLGRKSQDMIGKYQGSFSAESKQFAEFDEMWTSLKNGKARTMIQHVIVNGKDYWISEAYSPIFDENGKPYQVLNIAVDITNSIAESNSI